MSNEHIDDHLSAERLQAFLDGELPGREQAAVRAHVDGCARCRTEMEAWESLFDDLGELATLAPSGAFRDRILESLPEKAGARERVRGWLGLESREGLGNHVGSPRLQEYMDGLVDGRLAARVEAHLDRCAVCRVELEELAAVARSVETLPRLVPSEGFQERVMAALRIQALAQTALAPTTLREKVTSWLRRRAVPSTPRGWAAALGTAVAPVATMALVLQAVFSHPRVTVGSLLSFVWFKVTELAQGMAGSLTASGLESSFVVEAWTFAREATQSPTLTAAGAALLSGLFMAALWVMYRNVFASHPEDQLHVQHRSL